VFTHQHFFESVIHRLFIHPLDDATLLFDLVDILAGVRPGHGVAARVAAHAGTSARLFRPAEPCVQLQQEFFVLAFHSSLSRLFSSSLIDISKSYIIAENEEMYSSMKYLSL